MKTHSLTPYRLLVLSLWRALMNVLLTFWSPLACPYVPRCWTGVPACRPPPPQWHWGTKECRGPCRRWVCMCGAPRSVGRVPGLLPSLQSTSSRAAIRVGGSLCLSRSPPRLPLNTCLGIDCVGIEYCHQSFLLFKYSPAASLLILRQSTRAVPFLVQLL